MFWPTTAESDVWGRNQWILAIKVAELPLTVYSDTYLKIYAFIPYETIVSVEVNISIYCFVPM